MLVRTLCPWSVGGRLCGTAFFFEQFAFVDAEPVANAEPWQGHLVAPLGKLPPISGKDSADWNAGLNPAAGSAYLERMNRFSHAPNSPHSSCCGLVRAPDGGSDRGAASTTVERPDQNALLARFPWLDGLNPPQQDAVLTTEGPVLMLAGAGTGKTRALTTRIAHLLLTGQARPGQILAVTFTNKAAKEMRERIEAMIGHPTEGWWVGTFHAICTRILRRHASAVGLKSNFSILDDDDQLRLIKQIMRAMDLDEKRWNARATLGLISRWKDKGLVPSKVPAGEVSDFANGRLLDIYSTYQDRLLTLNACDFGDLLLHCLTLFTHEPDILADYQDRFAFMLVDEYQDTNVAQYLWLRLLAQKRKNICCVGDDDQSIYGWRGAEVGNILRFEKDFPGAKVIRLEQNYRSTSTILATASGLIAHNEGRLGKTLWTQDKSTEKVQVRGYWDGDEEARQIAEAIEQYQAKGTSLHDMAVLVRSSAMMRGLEERFVTVGIPYRVVGGPRFYERREIRDALAYLRVVAQPADDLAFERIVNVPKRGIGPTTVQKLYGIQRDLGLPLTGVVEQVLRTDEIGGKARKSLQTLIGDFDRWRAMVASTPHPELTEIILDESGYTEMWRLDRSPEAPGRLENLKELISAMASFDSLAAFLEHVSLVMEGLEDNSTDMVSIMTLHGAKGLEFDLVFLPGWEQGQFPNQRALDAEGQKGLEEERRLGYVGITRARKSLYISYAGRRRIHGQYSDALPSQFLEELPEEQLELVSTASSWGSNWLHQDSNFSAPSTGFGANWGSSWNNLASARPATGGTSDRGFGADRGFGYESPGWKRAQARRNHGKIIQGSPRDMQPAQSVKATRNYAVGERVFHQKFGYGDVLAVDKDRLVVNFDISGEKKIMSSFIVPASDA